MKRLLIALFVASALYVQAQNYEVLHVEEFPGMYFYCFDNDISGLIIYGETDCNAHWFVFPSGGGDLQEWDNMDSIIIHNPHEPMMYDVQYDGCENNTVVGGIVIDVLPINPFVEPIIWTRQNDSESVTLNADPNGLELNYQWSTGDTTQTIEVSEPGIYSVTIINDCGSATYSVEIRDNVELYRATVDLQTNKNKVIWLVTPEQAQYITSVKIYRDNIPVDTAPYTNGYFLDAIGSDAAARNYRIVGVSVEGDDCPIPSYEKGTIHTTYYEDVDGNLNMTWNTPYIEEGAQGTLTGFQICKYNPATEEVTVIDQVNASITDYTCSSSAFIGGQATIAAIFDSKDTESRSFSNRNTMLAVSENEENHFKVYPNPAKDRVTVEGTGLMTVTNTLGQTILTKEIDGKATIDLPQGLYFVKLGNEMQKIVVE